MIPAKIKPAQTGLPQLQRHRCPHRPPVDKVDGCAYACELYATALASNGELSDAENFYRDAKGRLKGEISEAERLLDCIDKNLACIKDAKDNAESE